MVVVAGSHASNWTLKKIFDRMDKGSDHLGTLSFSDSSLAFAEFKLKIDYYREERRCGNHKKNSSKVKTPRSTQRVEKWLQQYKSSGKLITNQGRSKELRELEGHWESKKTPMRSLTKKRPFAPGLSSYCAPLLRFLQLISENYLGTCCCCCKAAQGL